MPAFGQDDARGGGSLRIGVALLAIALYAWLALASGIDRLADQGRISTIGPLWPFGAGHARAAAKSSLIAKTPAVALASAREAVRRDPFDAEAIGLMGTAALASGDHVGAARAFTVAGRLGWREPLAQDYLMNAALARDDVHDAADHLDAILRQSPGLSARNLLLAPFDATPAGRHELAARLVLRPAWAQAYFADTAALEAGDPLARAEVAVSLAKLRLHDCALVAPVIAGLLQHDHYDQAVMTYGLHCQTPERQLDPPPVDHRFTHADIAHPATALDWHFADDGALDLAIAPDRGGSGNMVIVSNASTTTLAFAEQPMRLKPGRIVVYWTARDASGAPSHAVEVAIACGANSPAWLAKTWAAGPNATEGADATISAACPRQRLVLGIAGGTRDVAIGKVTVGYVISDTIRLK